MEEIRKIFSSVSDTNYVATFFLRDGRFVISKNTSPVFFTMNPVDIGMFEEMLKKLGRSFVVKRIYKDHYISEYESYVSGTNPVEISYEVLRERC